MKTNNGPYEGRRYLDPALKIKTWEDVAPYFDRLAERDLSSSEQIERWLVDYSETQSATEEFMTDSYVQMSRASSDEAKRERYLYALRHVAPNFERASARLNQIYLSARSRASLESENSRRVDHIIATSARLYSEKNLARKIREGELAQEYDQLNGSITARFEGRVMTLQKIGSFLKDNDRARRRSAFMTIARARAKFKDRFNEIYLELIQTRSEIARQVGMKSFVEYSFTSKLRDYSPEDCFRFHDSIEKIAIPTTRSLLERRKQKLRLTSIAPYDTSCDISGRPKLTLYKKPEELFAQSKKIFHRIDPRFGELFDSLRESVDLESREGKIPGGYQATFEEAREPFIFMNGVGSTEDLNTLLHEGGHALHTFHARGLPLIWLRRAPIEFSEVASMSMELVGSLFLDQIIADKSARERIIYERFESIAHLFLWVARIDAFQLAVYSSADAPNPDQIGRIWLDLADRFNPGIDQSELDSQTRATEWHRQLHLFSAPFYYIEYAIAQLGALELYANYKRDPDRTIKLYKEALALGGSKSAPELFTAAGIEFDFGSATLSAVFELIANELDL